MKFPFRSILVPLDFDDSSRPALEMARELAVNSDASIHLVHVLPVFLAPGEPAAAQSVRTREVQQTLEQSAQEQLHGLEHDVLVRIGEVGKEIVEAATTVDADLIVMPTHGRRGMAHLLLGSVAERVVREARCPVLTLRPVESATPAKLLVGMVMVKEPPSLATSDTLARARACMDERQLLSIPVLSEGHVVGIITDRDLRSRQNQLEATQVGEVMTRGPIMVAPTTDLEEAGRLLVKLRVGALPVVEAGKLVGIISTDEVITNLIDRQ